MQKKLYRSRQDRIVAGVCTGAADYFSLDPTLVRLLWALFTVINVGAGLLAYLAAVIVIPEEPSRRQEAAAAGPAQSAEGDTAESEAVGETGVAETESQNAPGQSQAPLGQRRTLLGVALVALGGFFMIRNFYPSFPFLETRYVWPSLLILIGTIVLANGFKGRS